MKCIRHGVVIDLDVSPNADLIAGSLEALKLIVARCELLLESKETVLDITKKMSDGLKAKTLHISNVDSIVLERDGVEVHVHLDSGFCSAIKYQHLLDTRTRWALNVTFANARGIPSHKDTRVFPVEGDLLYGIGSQYLLLWLNPHRWEYVEDVLSNAKRFIGMIEGETA